MSQSIHPSAGSTSPSPPPVTAVIPAHNEAPRIGTVLGVLQQVPLVRHIIVVDDGSTDDTAQVVQRWAARDPRIRLLRFPENRGKGAAMVEGARRSPSDIVLFLDADLVGLRPQHVEDLIWPVLRGEADMTVGRFRGGRLHTDWSHALTPFLSGQRCLRWSVFARTPELEEAGWGAETAFHLHAAREGLRLERVILHGVTQVTKEEKAKFAHAARAR
ncbi:MAG: glycosyltransferase family 2 protein, partial [Anaerolineae bacterium]|nr:glycosyltransferase family 2 protein [Anaerolineae bacterium]